MTSDFFTHHTVLIVVFLVIAALCIRLFSQSASGQYFFQNLAFRLPAIGPVYKQFLVAQVMANLSLLLTAGISINRTLELTAEASNNVFYRDFFF